MLNKLLNSPLFDKIVLSKLFELRRFILAEDLWQHKLLNSSSFASKVQGYGINGRLWDKKLRIFSRYGLIKADKVLLNSNRQFDYLLAIKRYDDRQTYLFTDIEDASKIDLTCILSKNNEAPIDYQPYFHSYRIYGVNRLFSLVKRSIVPYQPFLDINSLGRLNRIHEDEIDSYIKSDDIWNQVLFYNVLIDFCIVSEVAFHSFVFQNISYSRTYEEAVQLRNELRLSLKHIYKTIDLDTIKLLREGLVTEAEREDPNATVHALIRMMNSDKRLCLKGKLGLSMLLLEMAEVLRRAAEYYFEINLDEENKVQGRWYFDGFMKEQFGTVRILDDPIAKNEFIRFLGLDYTLRAKIYVEGVTEYGFLEEAFAGIHAIQIINLEGKFSEGKRKGIAFRDSLREDQRLRLFSFVFIDNDRKDNIRVLEKAVSDNDFFGMFFKSNPDFECGNFSAVELYSALCNNYNFERNQRFLTKKDSIKSSSNFFSVMNELHQNQRFSKSKEWGKALCKFACQSDQEIRPLLEFVKKILISLQCGYEWHKQIYKVDSNTGLLIEKPKNGTFPISE